MKRNLIIFALLFIKVLTALAFSVSAHAADKDKGRINLADINTGFPFLKLMMDEDELSNFNNYRLKYYKKDQPLMKNIKDVNIYSEMLVIDGIKYSYFSIFTQLNRQQGININWKIEEDEDFESLRIDSVYRMLRLSVLSKKRNINDTILSGDVWYMNDYPFKVNYDDTGKTDRIKSYEFTVETGNPPGPRFWRTLLEVSSVSIIGGIRYWVRLGDNREDWEYPPTRDGFKRKLGDRWKFDKNSFQVNTIDHIWGGAWFHMVARSNGYGFYGSVVWSFMGSLFWEYIAEYREAVSLNDMIFTPAGAFLGEGLRQASIYVENQFGHTFLGKVMMVILDPVRFINRGIDILVTDSYRVNLIFLNPVQMMVEESYIRK